MIDKIINEAKDGVVAAIKGTGEVVNTLRTTVKDVVVGTLKDTGEVAEVTVGTIASVAKGAVTGGC